MKKSIILPALILGVAFSMVLWPLFRPGFFVSDDGEWMVIRLSAFYQSLASGQFPVRFLGRLNNSYGYPVANFLYPGFLYIGSILHYFGLSFVDAVKAIMALSVITGALAIFAALRARFSMLASLTGSVSYIGAPYLLYDLYYRGSVGEILALGVAAVAIVSIIKGWGWMLAPAIGFLIISHNTVALIVGVSIACLLFIHRGKKRLLVSSGLGVGTATFFWLPALVEKGMTRFDTITVSEVTRYFIGIDNVALLGMITILALVVTIGTWSTWAKEDAFMVGFVVIGVLLSLPLSAPLWRFSYMQSLIQFPYRFLVLVVLFGPWVVALATERLKGWKLWLLFVVIIVVLTTGVRENLRRIQFVDRPIGYYTTNEGTTNVANEYMPRWVKEIPQRRAVETLEVIDGDATLSSRTFVGEHIDVMLDAKEDSTIQINKIYYPGWGVTIDSRLTKIDYKNAMGVIRITVPQGNHRIVAAFRETPFRFAADVLSLLSAIMYIVLIRRLSLRS